MRRQASTNNRATTSVPTTTFGVVCLGLALLAAVSSACTSTTETPLATVGLAKHVEAILADPTRLPGESTPAATDPASVSDMPAAATARTNESEAGGPAGAGSDEPAAPAEPGGGADEAQAEPQAGATEAPVPGAADSDPVRAAVEAKATAPAAAAAEGEPPQGAASAAPIKSAPIKSAPIKSAPIKSAPTLARKTLEPTRRKSAARPRREASAPPPSAASGQPVLEAAAPAGLEGMDATDLYHKGVQQLHNGQAKAATVTLSASQRLRPSARTLAKLGQAYMDAGKLKEAEKTLSAAGRRPEAMLLLAILFQQTSRVDRTRKTYNAFLTHHPNHPRAAWVRNILKQL